MHLHIRPFASGDYTAMLAIHLAVFPDYKFTEDEMRYWDEHRDPTHKYARLVAEHDERSVGIGEYGQAFDEYHPRKFWMNIIAHPDVQRRGIGSALYDQVMQDLQQHDPIAVRSQVREDMAASIRFLEARGFRNVWRSWESRLDLTTFDPAPYQGLEEKLRDQGIEIKTLAELASDPECYRKLYELDNEVARDIPTLDESTAANYEFYVETFIDNLQLKHDAHFIALHNGEYIGTTSLWESDGDTDLTNSLTGVKRSYRHRGIALVLKLRSIAYARARGCGHIKTWNDSPNTAMIAINERLGFVRKVGWITFLKEF